MKYFYLLGAVLNIFSAIITEQKHLVISGLHFAVGLLLILYFLVEINPGEE